VIKVKNKSKKFFKRNKTNMVGGGGYWKRVTAEVDRLDVVKVCLAAKSMQKILNKKEGKEEI
jgi:hypothetical protein